jgi:ParB-like chromosome segregation protein Spo0J
MTEDRAYRDRIVRYATVRAGDLVPHPRNWRGPDDPDQTEAVRASMTEVGQVVPLCVYQLPEGKLGLIDGHLRAGLNPEAPVAVAVTDL